MRISDWSSDVCSSDLSTVAAAPRRAHAWGRPSTARGSVWPLNAIRKTSRPLFRQVSANCRGSMLPPARMPSLGAIRLLGLKDLAPAVGPRSEEHTSELQSLMRISYAVFCLKKKKTKNNTQLDTYHARYYMMTYNKK